MTDTRIGENELLATIDHLYEAALEPSMLPAAFDRVAHICGGMGITLFPRDPADNVITYVSPAIREAASEYFTDWLDRCPRIAYSQKNPIFDRVFWDGDILDDGTLEGDPYFRDYGRRYDLQFSVIRSTTGLDEKARYIFSSPFSLKAGVPAAHQMKAFEILSGHAVRTLQVFRRLTGDQSMHRGLDALMEHQDHGVMILNAFGRVVHANRAATSHGGGGLSVQNGRAVAATGDGQKALDTLIRLAIWPDVAAPDLKPLGLARGPGRRPLLVHAIALKAEQRIDPGGLLRANAGVMLVIVDPEQEPATCGPEAFRLLGLTATEARIAAILGAGVSPETAAESLGISVGTVRNHIKRIFSKLEISRQGELVRLAAHLVAVSQPNY